MTGSISCGKETASSFSTTINVRFSNKKINVIKVSTFGQIYRHYLTKFYILSMYNYILYDFKFTEIKVHKSYVL